MSKNKDIEKGTYISVDRIEAFKANWDIIQSLSLPGTSEIGEEEFDIASVEFLRQT